MDVKKRPIDVENTPNEPIRFERKSTHLRREFYERFPTRQERRVVYVLCAFALVANLVFVAGVVMLIVARHDAPSECVAVSMTTTTAPAASGGGGSVASPTTTQPTPAPLVLAAPVPYYMTLRLTSITTADFNSTDSYELLTGNVLSWVTMALPDASVVSLLSLSCPSPMGAAPSEPQPCYAIAAAIYAGDVTSSAQKIEQDIRNSSTSIRVLRVQDQVSPGSEFAQVCERVNPTGDIG